MNKGIGERLCVSRGYRELDPRTRATRFMLRRYRPEPSININFMNDRYFSITQ